SPAHFAHAAYHPYTAQTQWIPLYFLALVALVDRVSVGRVAAFLLAGIGLVFSNYDAGVMGIVLSPVVIVAFWAVRPDVDRNLRPLIWPVVVLATIALAGIGLTVLMRPEVFSRAYRLQFPIEEVGLYRAHWWAYFVPAV